MQKRFIYAVTSLLLCLNLPIAIANVGFVKFQGSVLNSGCYIHGQQGNGRLHKYGLTQSDVLLDLSYCQLSQKGEVLAEVRVRSPFFHNLQIFPLEARSSNGQIITVQDRYFSSEEKQQIRLNYKTPLFFEDSSSIFEFEIIYR